MKPRNWSCLLQQPFLSQTCLHHGNVGHDIVDVLFMSAAISFQAPSSKTVAVAFNMGASSSRESPVDEAMRTQFFLTVFEYSFLWIPFMHGNFHHVRTALTAVQQIQQMQQMQMQQMQASQSAQPAQSAPVDGQVAQPAEPAETQETDWWYQGPGTCRKCGQKSYLRGGICYNMECVSWLCNTFFYLQGVLS